MGLARSLGQWIKALGYLLTGRLDAAREVLETNPLAVRAKYDAIIREKISRVQEYKKAVASLVAQKEKKVHQVDELTKEISTLEDLKTGAAAKAKQVVEKLQAAGKATEQIHQDAEYQKCLAAFNDFSSTLQEKQARIAELESGIAEHQDSIGGHKVQLQQLLRDLDKLKSEAAEAVTDMITSREEKELSDMITGISEDGTAEELQRLRDLRQKAKAETRISKELAGTDTKAQEAEFLEYARKGAATQEFDALIGLGAAKDAAQKQRAGGESEAKLPE